MISVCIITKNEEKNISKCLDSIKPLAKEIILVDTGSDDKTVEIAKQYTNKIFNYPWKDNFSDAKNFALSKATQEWILFLDADESISFKDLKKLDELTNSHEIAFNLIQRNYTNNLGVADWVSTKNDSYDESKLASGYSPRKMTRLFRNFPGIRFEGAVHENIANSILKIGKIIDTEIPIHHYGSLIPNKEKIEKYIEISKKEAKDYFDYCKIGVQLASINKKEEALVYLRKSIKENPKFLYSWQELGKIMIQEKNFTEARQALHNAESLGENPETLNYLGIVYGYEGEYEKSIDYLKRAVALSPKNADYHFNLGLTYYSTSNLELAGQEFLKACDLNPEYKKRVYLG